MHYENKIMDITLNSHKGKQKKEALKDTAKQRQIRSLEIEKKPTKNR